MQVVGRCCANASLRESRFYRAHLLAGNPAFVDALVREIERRGANALPVFAVSSKEEAGAVGARSSFLQP